MSDGGELLADRRFRIYVWVGVGPGISLLASNALILWGGLTLGINSPQAWAGFWWAVATYTLIIAYPFAGMTKWVIGAWAYQPSPDSPH